MSNYIDVLLVDDSAEDAEIAMREIKKSQLVKNPVHVENGEEALKLIFGKGNEDGSSTVRLPGLVMLDIKMPKVNGIEVLESIKKDPRTSSIPVVMLTSSSEESDLKKCYELGVNSYIVKPVDFKDYTDSLQKIVTYWRSVNYQQ